MERMTKGEVCFRTEHGCRSTPTIDEDSGPKQAERCCEQIRTSSLTCQLDLWSKAS